MANAASVYRSLWRHKLFIVAAVAACVAGAWYLTSRATPMYKASVLVRVQQRIASPAEAVGSLAAGQVLAQTYAEIVATRAVADGVGRELSRRVPRSEIDVSGSPVQDLGLLWITAHSADPAVAAEVANAAPVALRRFIARTGTLRDEIVTIDDAAVPTHPYSPHWVLNLTLAALAGLLLAIVASFLYDLLSARIPDTDALADELGVPVIASVPPLEFQRKRKHAPPAVRAEDPGEGVSVA